MRPSGVPGTVLGVTERDERTLREAGLDSAMAEFVTGLDLDTRICDLESEVWAMLNATRQINPREDVPPGPWVWRRVHPAASSDMGGEVLVAEDSTWVAWSESGHGLIETVNAATKALLADAWRLTPETFRDHDHDVEAAVDDALEDPTPENQRAAVFAVATLQRRYGHVLRRLDGDGEVPPYPVHRHNAADTPADCLHAVLHQLSAKLDDRAETLAHGLTAARALESQRNDARRLATVLWELLSAEQRAGVDPDEYLWTPVVVRLEAVPSDEHARYVDLLRRALDDEALLGLVRHTYNLTREEIVEILEDEGAAEGALGDERRLFIDPHREDDEGNLWTFVELDDLDPTWLYPGAVVRAGIGDGSDLVTVLRTELFETTTGRTTVLVTVKPPVDVG